jgi:hypothetical protein
MHPSELVFTGSSGACSRKAAANRENSQKSTGPKTDAGKARSSRNSVRHGLLAGAATLLAEPDREITALLTSYRSDFRPSSAHEDFLVNELAVTAWRLKQITRIETGLMAFQMQATYDAICDMDKPARWAEAFSEESECEPPLSEAGDDLRTVAMGAAWAHNTPAFSLPVRYHAQARRDYSRLLKQLEALRTGQAGYLPPKTASPIGKPAPPQPGPAASETNPAPVPEAAAAPNSAERETKPTSNETAPNLVEFNSKPDGRNAFALNDPLRVPSDKEKNDGNGVPEPPIIKT